MIRVTCPVCQRLMEGQRISEWPEFPFCSPRCKLIDLGRWLGERYGIPAEEPDDSLSPEEMDTP